MSTAPKEPPRTLSEKSLRDVQPVPPIELDARSTSPAASAGGVPAVAEAFSVTLKQAGVRRGVSALRMLNQKDGFDCPGCAWPDPDGERTNNLPDCSNMCHESSGAALTPVIGVGKGTVTLRDFELADLIFVIGQNPGTCHPRMLTYLQAAARRGCAIVSVNPLAEAGLVRFKHPQHPLEWIGSGTPIAQLFLPVRINGDQAFFQGVAKEMLEAEERNPGSVLEREFIAQKTSGFDEYTGAIRRQSWDRIIQLSGLSREQIRQAVELAMRSKAIICCWAMGLTQHRNAVGTIQEIVNFLLLRGTTGGPGTGLCPVRGHSNVQGDRTMGIWEKPSPGFSCQPQPRIQFLCAHAPRIRYGGAHSRHAVCPG